MDEAEFLSDKVGIMKDASLVCSGTPNAIKDQFNLGYRLNIEKENDLVASQPIIAMIQKIYPQIEVQSTVPS